MDYSKRPPVRAGGFSLLPAQSPHGFSDVARLYFYAGYTRQPLRENFFTLFKSIMGPFIRGKIGPVLHKTRPK